MISKKISFSLLGGLLIGLAISLVLMDYKDMSFEILDQGGIESRWIREIDFNFIFNASLLVIGTSILLFVIWTFIEKFVAKKYLSDSNN
ncbi:hypothetical protein ACFPYN_11940 [Paenisporosarcina macmurdoensis]|uniref:Uncharacterized protein n=1 Tax=Paenisporosarcina macmurdoensis TaxID=212659 RepID=A0ABW1LA40_9BACL